MSDSKRWQGGEKIIRPRIEDVISDPEDPFYIPTPIEYEKQKEAEKKKEKEQNPENKISHA